MTDTPAHTPLPWAISNGSAQYIWGDARWVAATMGVRDAEGAANAAFIVRACNSHYQLVEALRELTEFCEKSCNGGMWRFSDQPISARARAALSQAGGASE